MAEKKTNEILEEQRKARQEFLELKKMQHGEMEAPPKPSEVAVVPKTPKEKWDNFWFHYKLNVIAVIAAVAILAVVIAQCAARTKYDLKVVYFSYTIGLDAQTSKIADYLEKYAEDTNDDGETNVQVINVSFAKNSGDSQYQYTALTKLQAIIAGGENAMLFITDSESYKYLDGIIEDGGLFEGEPYKFGEDFYKATKTEEFGALPDGLQISCRKINDTTIEKQKGAKEAYESSNRLLDKLKEAS